MLEEIGVQLLVFHSGIGLHVIAEFAHLQVKALGLELGFDEVQNLGVRHGGGSNLQHLLGVHAQCSGGNGEGSQGFLQHSSVFQVTVNAKFRPAAGRG